MGTFDHLSKEELISLLEKRQAERKLGLVWERNEIDHDQALTDGFVAMEMDEEFSAGAAPHRNMIIEGDNFDALRFLQLAYKGKVNVFCKRKMHIIAVEELTTPDLHFCC